ncbi:hypothetical protein F4804DRAFT_329989 [Jackrogersella minutella]|nr:hypothetical protein F4804DRAFT_329989 [Jackrogersella minutella]
MAVFANGKICMDRRVREAPKIQRLVLGILEVLQGRIEECIRLVEHLINPSCPIEMRVSVLAKGDLERAADEISSEIGLLHELSNTIRKASKESQNLKVATSLRMTDDEGNDIEDILRGYHIHYLQDRFPKSADSIRNRLTVTMILRHKRILYRRSRYSGNLIKSSTPVLKPNIETLNIAPQQEAQEQGLSSQSIQPESVAPSRICSTVQSATTLAPQAFQRASAPSIVSHVESVDLRSHENLVLPPCPGNPNQHMIEVTCPYCFNILSSHEANNEAGWMKHVLNYLDALVCLFDPCDEPEVLYAHSKDWLHPMCKHAQRWRCSAKVHGVENFSSREEYEIRMRDDHGKHYNRIYGPSSPS